MTEEGADNAALVMPAAAISFAPPIITANMLPKPHTSVEKQSAEDWFKIFYTVADSLIGIYRTANQEVVGQRQALATIPSLLNRNESEQRLSTRILQECTTIREAEALVIRTVGNLENECQATEMMFNLKRSNRSLEDFYAILIEKEKTGRIGMTNVIKKFIAELPDNVKPSLQRKFSEYRTAHVDGELPNNLIEDLYARARRSYNDQSKQAEASVFAVNETKTAKLEEMLNKQNEEIQELHDKLEAFTVRDNTKGTNDSKRNIRCFHCDRIGHQKKECWTWQAEQRAAERRGRGRRNVSNDIYCDLDNSGDVTAVMVNGRINNTKMTLMIDTGAGPCVIDINTLNSLSKHDKMKCEGPEKQLQGLGNTSVLGTITLLVTLHPEIKQRQTFYVVKDLGGMILLGRKFLTKFEKLEVNWRKMSLKIGNTLIKGKRVIQGGSLDSRVYVAQNKVTTEDKMKGKLRDHVSKYRNLSNSNKEELLKVLEDNADLFIENPKSPPEAQLVSHVVDTRNAQPIADKTRRFSPKMAAEIEEHVTEMLTNGICQPSKSPWSSQVLLSRKKDGTMRFVIDYRKLNDVTVKDDYPMPNIRDLIDEVSGAKYFSCMDMPSAYWHVPMDEESIPKTAFQVPQGKYEMLRMPYGMKNSQATQQRLMDRVLAPVPDTRAYVDNTFTHSKEFQDHINALKQTFQQFRKHNLSVRLDKCIFAQHKVEQFGLVISEEGVTPSPENVSNIKAYPRPNNVKELRRFLGMANYYREFVPKYAEISEPLQELERKETAYVWTEAREKALLSLKDMIANNCLLNFPDWNKPFIIELDGSKVAACGVLMQEEKGKRKVLGFHSSTLDPAQRNYCPTELEAWAAISACRRFKCYIKGAPSLVLRSDHEPLQWLRKQRDPRGKFSRWIMELEQYDYKFEYKPGKDIEGPDALSRIAVGKTKTDGEDPLEENVYVVKIASMEDWKELLKKEQRNDKSINIAREQLEQQNNVLLGRYKNYKQLFIQDGLMTKSGRIIVPSSLRYQVTKDFHDLHHWGITNTYKEIKKNYYWSGMENYIQQYCASCDTCLQTKSPNKKPKAELKPQQWENNEPGQAIALDLATLTPSYDGFKYIMLITDGMSKFTELCPLRNMTATSVVKNIERNWIARHGIPSTLLTDQGTQVDGVEIRDMCEKYGITKKRSSPYHPEGDGISERPIGVMKGLFRRKIVDKKLPQRKWTDILPEVQLAMNQKVHSSTNLSPFQLMYGDSKRFDTRKPQMQGVFNGPPQELNPEERSYSKLTHIENAKTSLASTAQRMKTQYDKKTSENHLSIGDLVYIKRESTKKGISKKLSTVYHELSTVVETSHPIYKVKRLGSGKMGWIHYNRLRKKGSFEHLDRKVDMQPQIQRNKNNPPDFLEEDCISELDYPIVISNSNTNEVDNWQNTVIDETIDNNNIVTDHVNNGLDDVTPIISLDGIEDVDAPEATEQGHNLISTGRTFDDEGRLRSTRTKKTTRTEEFKY